MYLCEWLLPSEKSTQLTPSWVLSSVLDECSKDADLFVAEFYHKCAMQFAQEVQAKGATSCVEK